MALLDLLLWKWVHISIIMWLSWLVLIDIICTYLYRLLLKHSSSYKPLCSRNSAAEAVQQESYWWMNYFPVRMWSEYQLGFICIFCLYVTWLCAFVCDVCVAHVCAYVLRVHACVHVHVCVHVGMLFCCNLFPLLSFFFFSFQFICCFPFPCAFFPSEYPSMITFRINYREFITSCNSSSKIQKA